MSIFLRVLPRMAGQTASLCRILAQPTLIRSLHQSPIMSATGLTLFEKRGLEIKRQAMGNDPSKTIANIRKKLLDPSKLEKNELSEVVLDLSLLVNTDEDIKLAIELLKDKEPSELQANVAVSNLYKRSAELNKRELLIEAFEKYPIFRNNIGFFTVASHYLDQNQEEKVVSLFEAYSPRYSDPSYLKKEQKLPFKHAQVMSTVFLKMNTRESLDKLKDLVKQAQVLKSDLGYNAKCNTVGLSILQNDLEYAEECLQKFQVDEINKSLAVNFKIIIKSRQKQVAEAISHLDFLIQARIFENKSNLKGKIFPFALNELKKAVEESKNEELTEKFKLYLSKLESEDRITDIDLKKYLCQNRQRAKIVRDDENRSSRRDSDKPYFQNRRPQNYGRTNNKDGDRAGSESDRRN